MALTRKVYILHGCTNPSEQGHTRTYLSSPQPTR